MRMEELLSYQLKYQFEYSKAFGKILKFTNTIEIYKFIFTESNQNFSLRFCSYKGVLQLFLFSDCLDLLQRLLIMFGQLWCLCPLILDFDLESCLAVISFPNIFLYTLVLLPFIISFYIF